VFWAKRDVEIDTAQCIAGLARCFTGQIFINGRTSLGGAKNPASAWCSSPIALSADGSEELSFGLKNAKLRAMKSPSHPRAARFADRTLLKRKPAQLSAPAQRSIAGRWSRCRCLPLRQTAFHLDANSGRARVEIKLCIAGLET